MITEFCQRWNKGRDSYRPAREVIDPKKFEVAEIKHHKEAKDFVVDNHYSKSFPASLACFGLYQGAQLSGVIVFSMPCSLKVLSSVFGESALECAELGRLVLLDSVLANGESFFLSRVLKLIKGRYAGIVSFSDPISRTTVGGLEVKKGHIGTIYQATNATFLGRSTARSLHILNNGEVFSDRSLQKIRGRERGWRYSAQILEAAGASPLSEKEDSREWLRFNLPRLSRVIRHPGNYRYAWTLDRAMKLPEGSKYPKVSL